MVRGPFYDKNGIKRGAWSSEEDDKLRAYVERYGHWNWRELPKFAGLARCGKSCRLRWINYLRPDVKRGNYTSEEESLIIKLHEEHGNKWSLIAAQLPGRTDNEVKNHWHTHLKKRASSSAQNKKPTKSQTHEELSHESSQCDQTSNNNEETDQAESSSTSTTPLNFVLSPQILEGAQLLPMDTNISTNSSGSSSSLIDHEPKPRIDCLGEEVVNNHLSNLSLEACQEYYYSAGSDFWTEPFMEDKTYMPSENECQLTCFGADGGISSPYYSFYDDGMDYFSLYST